MMDKGSVVADDAFEDERPALFAIAYRMLGERSGAEDIVQETWLRWTRSPRDTVKNPSAWLRKIAANLSIDALRSARARREIYVGPWLPEAIVEDDPRTGEDILMLAEECELALLWAMERLAPEERAAFILREAFDTPYSEIAGLLGKSEAASRQIVSRASKRIKSSGPKFEATNEEVSELLESFMHASFSQDKNALLKLLAPDATALSDGGGKVRAALRPLIGPEEIAQVLLSVASKVDGEPNITMTRANGRPAISIREGGAHDMLLSLAIDEDSKIKWIYIMRNPDKLPNRSG